MPANVAATTVREITTATHPLPADIPASTQIGDLLIVIEVNQGNLQAGTTPTGWSKVADFSMPSGVGQNRFIAFWKIAASGEAGTTVNFPTQFDLDVAATMYCLRVSGATAAPVISTATNVSGSNSGDTSFDTPSQSNTAGNTLDLTVVAAASSAASSSLLALPGGATEVIRENRQSNLQHHMVYTRGQRVPGTTTNDHLTFGTVQWWGAIQFVIKSADPIDPPFLGSVSHGRTTGNANVVVTPPAGVNAGEVLLLQMSIRPYNSALTHASWTLIADVPDPDSRLRLKVFTRVAQAGDPSSWTFTDASAVLEADWSMTRWPVGSSIGTPTTAGAGFSASLVLPTLTAPANSTLVAMVAGSEGGASTHAVVGPGSMTKEFQYEASDSMGWNALFTEPRPAAGATGTRTFTWSWGDRMAGALVAITDTGTPIVYQGSATNANSTNTTSHVVNVPAGVASGDLLLAHIVLNDGSLTLATPTGWTLVASKKDAGNDAIGYVFYRIAGGSEPSSYTFTSSANCWSNTAMSRWTGAAVSPINAHTEYGATSSIPADVPLSLTTTVNNTMLVGFLGSDTSSTASTWQQPANFFEIYDVCGSTQIAIEAAYKSQVTAGATGTQTWTLSGGFQDGIFVALAPFVPDTSGPTVAITAPANGATINGTVALAATASDPSGVASVQFKVDGVNVGAADTTSPYSVNLDTTTLTDAVHTISAVATDTVGNASTDSISVTVLNDLSGPTTAITSPADGAYVTGTITLTATASDPAGVQGVQWKVDGTNYGSQDTSSPYTTTLDTSTLSEGAHTITAVATDNHGNTTTVSVTIHVDRTGPALSWDQPASDGLTVSRDLTVSVSASDASGVDHIDFFWEGSPINSDTTSPWGFTWDTRGVSNGSGTLSATAYDIVGNSTTITRTLTVANDVTAPFVEIIAPNNGDIVVGSIQVRVVANDASGINNVSLQIDGVPFGDPITVPVSGEYVWTIDTIDFDYGYHTITAIAFDNSGGA